MHNVDQCREPALPHVRHKAAADTRPFTKVIKRGKQRHGFHTDSFSELLQGKSKRGEIREIN
jgi:hypothetical protein